jgi:hypothetical protein
MPSIAFIGNPTSISYLIARELRHRGYDVDVIADSVMAQTGDRKQQPSLFQRGIRKYCKPAYHMLYNRKGYDIELRAFSNPIVKARYRSVIYHGNDLRDSLWPIEYPCFYSTVDLGLRYLDLKREAVWLPRCFVSEYFSPEPRIPFDGKNLTIGFFPSDPRMEARGLQGKGPQRVYEAIKILQMRGYEVELLTPEIMGHVPHEKMSELYRRCHVVADQFHPNVGMYGVVSLEAIASNRPVVCHVRDEYFEYEEMKRMIVNSTPAPENIADALIQAVDRKFDPKLVKQLYSEKRSADVLEKTLQSWGYLY